MQLAHQGGQRRVHQGGVQADEERREQQRDVQIIQPGLLRHPASVTSAGLRATALHRRLEQYQQLDPFKFLIYAELAGAEIGPVE
jgi:hypothetical protein